MNSAVIVIMELEQNVDFISNAGLHFAQFILEFVNRDLAFRFVPDVHHDKIITELDDPSADYLALLDISEALLIKVVHGIRFFIRLMFVRRRKSLQFKGLFFLFIFYGHRSYLPPYLIFGSLRHIKAEL